MKNNYNIGIRNGLIDTKHFESLGIAIWLYLWIIGHQTRNSDKVLGGKPVTYEMVVNDYNTLSRRTFERWLKIIKAGGYISTLRTPYGHIITICKPKKWEDSTTDMPNMAHLKRQKRHISPPNMAHLIKT